MQLRTGTRIGRYELLQRLGAGAMGEVFRARDHDLGRDVAIKFLPRRLASDAERMVRFVKEARAASSLNHPNIVIVHEVGHAEGAPFLVMEYIEGQTLRQLLRIKSLSPKQILDIAVQIADGLVKAHAAGIVHRDLKPENLMITADGLVKILDFGLAKLYQPNAAGLVDGAAPPSEAVTLSFPPISSEGMIVGTVGYMSPEQASGRPVDFRSDQFVLGAILYEMVAGRRAFQRSTPVQTLSATIDTEPESLTSLNTSFPAPARWVLERCLSKDPKDRYASTADLALELRSVREHLSEVSTLGKGPDMPRLSGLRRVWLIFAFAMAVLLGLFTVPSVRENILEQLQLLSLPHEKRIAVLPFRYSGGDDNDRLLCDGLLSYLTERLSQLERFQEKVWIVPALEVREAGVVSPQTARRALGATIVVDGSLQRSEGRLLLSTRLVDANRLRQLRITTIEIAAGKTSLLQETVNAVVGMLDLELRPEEQSAVRAAQTGVVEASTAYGQALGYTSYKQARTALERYEQQQNLERAISLFNEALRRDPRYALAHAGLGEAYWRLSRFTHKEEHVALAEQHCQRALDLDDTLAEAWMTLGILHSGTGKAEQAVADLERAIDRDPRNAGAYRELANAYSRLKRETDAEATYRKAIAL
jgi:serine/threonine protein kinase/Flp pilus assembly protein TadD